MVKKCCSQWLTGSAFSNKGTGWSSYLPSLIQSWKFPWNPSSGDVHGSDKGSSANGRYICS